MAPGALVILAGVNPMNALIMSQVCLSFVLPVTIISLLIITNKKSLMGDFVNKNLTKIIGWIIAALIIGLNIALIFLTLSGGIA